MKDGGQAFPESVSMNNYGKARSEDRGMTLHQWFAGQALAGMLASEAHPQSMGSWVAHHERAEQALNAADAMLAEYEKRKEQEK